MAEETTKQATQASPTNESVLDDVDDEARELLEHIVAMLCDTDNVKVTCVYRRGDNKSVNFIVDLCESRHRAMLIGREGRTIQSIQLLYRAIAGVNHRYYNVTLVED